MVLREPLGCSRADLQDEPFLPPYGLYSESRVGSGLTQGI